MTNDQGNGKKEPEWRGVAHFEGTDGWTWRCPDCGRKSANAFDTHREASHSLKIHEARWCGC